MSPASGPRRYVLPPPPPPSPPLTSTECIPPEKPEGATPGSCSRSKCSFESRRRLRGLCGEGADDEVESRRSIIAEGAGNGSEGRPFRNDGGVAGDVSSQGR